RLMSTTQTAAPSAAIRLAVARPIPEAPPVITARWLSNRPMLPLLSVLSGLGDSRVLLRSAASPAFMFLFATKPPVGLSRAVALATWVNHFESSSPAARFDRRRRRHTTSRVGGRCAMSGVG